MASIHKFPAGFYFSETVHSAVEFLENNKAIYQIGRTAGNGEFFNVSGFQCVYDCFNVVRSDQLIKIDEIFSDLSALLISFINCCSFFKISTHIIVSISNRVVI